MHTAIPLTVLATALACSLATTPAHARARVFVASYGNDSNPCTFGSPCKTFQQAVNVVDAGGEVTAIDSAGFGPINITKAVAITSPNGVEAGIVPVSGGTGITINAGPNDAVHLEGLHIEGGGIGGTGIAFLSGNSLVIDNCVVRKFQSSGIGVAPSTSVTIAVSKTLVADNGGHGIYVQPTTGNGDVRASFNRVEAYHNGGVGIGLYANFFSGTVYGIATETTATFNGITGFYALGGSFIGGAAWEIFNSTARHNNPSDPYSFITDDIHAGAGSVIYVGHSMVGNWNEDTGALLGSFGDNDTFYPTGHQFTTH